MLILHHKCPEFFKIAIKIACCTYGFRNFQQKKKIWLFTENCGKFFSHGYFLQTSSGGACDHVLVQNMSFSGLYRVHQLVYCWIFIKRRLYDVFLIIYGTFNQLIWKNSPFLRVTGRIQFKKQCTTIWFGWCPPYPFFNPPKCPIWHPYQPKKNWQGYLKRFLFGPRVKFFKNDENLKITMKSMKNDIFRFSLSSEKSIRTSYIF